MSKSKNNSYKIIISLLLMILILIIAGFFGYSYVIKDINGNRNTKTEYHLVIEKDDFAYQIGEKLKTNGIINSDTVWNYWMDKNHPNFSYTNGEYELNSSMSYEEIAKKLKTPDVSHKTVSVVIPEGYNIFDIAKTLEKNNICSKESFLNACKKADDYDYDFLNSVPNSSTIAYQLEGFLFPATYDFAENSEAKDIASQMLEAFSYKITDNWTDYCKNNNMTLYELITLSSVVQKETLGDGVAQNIASVFINRLNNSQQLQSDVTIDYGNLLRENGFSDDIVTSYNTYKCSALPSGPICNPGVENIDATVNHNDTNYFYFFSDLNQEFHFAKDYDEFEQLKQKYPWQ